MSQVERLSDGFVWLTMPTLDDVDAIAAACADPSIAEWTAVPVPYTRADAESFVGTTVPTLWREGSPTWAIRAASDGVALGMSGFVARDADVVEVGYWIAPWQRFRGFATSALKLMCQSAFRSDELGFERVEWRAYVGNHASAVMARRVGFRYEGLIRRGVQQRGVRRDCWLAALLPDDDMVPAVDWPAGV